MKHKFKRKRAGKRLSVGQHALVAPLRSVVWALCAAAALAAPGAWATTQLAAPATAALDGTVAAGLPAFTNASASIDGQFVGEAPFFLDPQFDNVAAVANPASRFSGGYEGAGRETASAAVSLPGTLSSLVLAGALLLAGVNARKRRPTARG